MFHTRSRRRFAAHALILGALLVTSSLAKAQPRRATPVLDAQKRTEIVDALADQLMQHYVEADTAKMIAAIIQSRLKAGAYDTLTSVYGFAETVTRDLRRVNGDLHLSLRFDPDGGSAGGGPVIVRRGGPGDAAAGPQGGGAGPRVVIRGGPGGGGGPGGPGGPVIVSGPGPDGGGDSTYANAPWAREARERNFGLGKAEILPGNVGYLEINGFMEAPGMEEALVGALKFLERTDAMIIDVRRNRGGSGNMSHLVFSHFLGEKPVPTINVKSREEGVREQTSFAEVPGPRRPDVPLYVLTSRGTGSAAEEFSFVLKNLGRATIVGDRTGGAGHMVGNFALPLGFSAGVSITRVSDPRTGAEWEAVGVQPDVKVDPDRALSTAHAAALRRIAAGADERRRHSIEMTAEWIEARDRAARPSAGQLAAYAGTYEGDREVKLEDGRLIFRRGGGIREEMVPLGGGRFALGGEARFTFPAGSPAPSFSLERADGSTGTYRRLSGSLKND